MRETLIRALCAEGLDLDAVTRVVMAVGGFDCPIDIDRFPPMQWGEYTIGLERFAHVCEELKPMHEAHWLETEKHRLGLGLNFDYERVREAERYGRVLQFTVRRAGELVGHARYYLTKSLHTQLLHGEEDTLYLKPEHRGGFVAIRLVKYGLPIIQALGARSAAANSKLVNKAAVLMLRCGFKPVATQFEIIFPEGAPDVHASP